MLLGQFGLVTSSQMFSQWKFVVVGATVVAAVLTPSTDPFTQVRFIVYVNAAMAQPLSDQHPSATPVVMPCSPALVQ